MQSISPVALLLQYLAANSVGRNGQAPTGVGPFALLGRAGVGTPPAQAAPTPVSPVTPPISGPGGWGATPAAAAAMQPPAYDGLPNNPAAGAPMQPPAADGPANNPAAGAPMQPGAYDGLPNQVRAPAPAAKSAPLPPPRPAGLLGGQQQGPEDNPFARWLAQNGNAAMGNFGAGNGNVGI